LTLLVGSHWEDCSPNAPWSFVASYYNIHFMNRRT